MKNFTLILILFCFSLPAFGQSPLDTDYVLGPQTLDEDDKDFVNGPLFEQRFPFSTGVLDFFYTDFNGTGLALTLEGSVATIAADIRFANFAIGCTTIALGELIRYHEPTPLSDYDDSTISYTYDITFKEKGLLNTELSPPAYNYQISNPTITIDTTDVKRDYIWSNMSSIREYEENRPNYELSREGTYVYNNTAFDFDSPFNSDNFVTDNLTLLLRDVMLTSKAEFIAIDASTSASLELSKTLKVYAFYNHELLLSSQLNSGSYNGAVNDIKESLIAGLPVIASTDASENVDPATLRTALTLNHNQLIYGWKNIQNPNTTTSDDEFWVSQGKLFKRYMTPNAIFFTYPFVQPHHYRYVSNNTNDHGQYRTGWVKDTIADIDDAINAEITVSDITQRLPDDGVIWLKGNDNGNGSWSDVYHLTVLSGSTGLDDKLKPRYDGTNYHSYSIRSYNGSAIIKPAP
ncbi:MAG: hypothetical protein COA79_23040 [Planctomycetota bacterium]|nr:MAG: hypothetical protein COA79_23040 [Planctomycetota bacterium]